MACNQSTPTRPAMSAARRNFILNYPMDKVHASDSWSDVFKKFLSDLREFDRVEAKARGKQ